MEVSHISLDPAMRGWMNAGASYIDPVEVGDVMRAGAVGTVSASEHPAFAVGDQVYGVFGVQEHALSDGKGVIKIDPSLAPLADVPRHARADRADRLLRAARRGQGQGGRHGRRVGRGRRGRQRRRTDREDQGRPRDRHRRRRGEVPLAGGGARLRRGDRLQDTRTCAARCASTRRRASTCTSTTSAARSSTRVLTRLARGARIVICGAVSQYNATEACRARPTTSRCWSSARR